MTSRPVVETGTTASAAAARSVQQHGKPLGQEGVGRERDPCVPRPHGRGRRWQRDDIRAQCPTITNASFKVDNASFSAESGSKTTSWTAGLHWDVSWGPTSQPSSLPLKVGNYMYANAATMSGGGSYSATINSQPPITCGGALSLPEPGVPGDALIKVTGDTIKNKQRVWTLQLRATDSTPSSQATTLVPRHRSGTPQTALEVTFGRQTCSYRRPTQQRAHGDPQCCVRPEACPNRDVDGQSDPDGHLLTGMKGNSVAPKPRSSSLGTQWQTPGSDRSAAARR